MTNLIVAFVMFVICIPTTSLVVFEAPEHSVDKEVLEGSDSEALLAEGSGPEVLVLVTATRIMSRPVIGIVIFIRVGGIAHGPYVKCNLNYPKVLG
jgi:hypothetical protein